MQGRASPMRNPSPPRIFLYGEYFESGGFVIGTDFDQDISVEDAVLFLSRSAEWQDGQQQENDGLFQEFHSCSFVCAKIRNRVENTKNKPVCYYKDAFLRAVISIWNSWSRIWASKAVGASSRLAGVKLETKEGRICSGSRSA